MTYVRKVMNHRVAAAFMAVVILVSAWIMPVEAAASDNTFTFSDSGVAVSGSGTGYEIDGTNLKITSPGTYTVTGSSAEGTVTVKKELTGVTLILSELTLSSSQTSPITVNKASQATIQVEGVNTITDKEDPGQEDIDENFEGAGIKVKTGGSLVLTGSGVLTVNGSCKNGIKGAEEASITVDGPTLNITAANDALSSDGTLTVKSGTFNIEAQEDAIQGAGDVDLLGGSFQIKAGDDAIHADYVLNVGVKGGSGPSITVTDSVEGFEGAVVNLYAGSGSITASDDGINAANSDLETGYAFAINVYGGVWKINAGGDAIDSNKDINLYGGVVEAFGSPGSGDSALDYDGSAVYEGGTLLAVGMSGMAQGVSSGTYVSFGSLGMMGGGGMAPQAQGQVPERQNGQTGTPPAGQKGQTGTPPAIQNGMPGNMGQGGPQNTGAASAFTISKGSSIVIKDSAGNTLYTATGLKTADSVVFADDSLVSGQTYTLYIDGTEAASATAAAGSTAGAPGGNQGGDSNFPFRDVTGSSWYYSAVRDVYQKKIMNGTSDTAFSPDSSMTRGMLAQILYNLAGSPKTDANAGFPDVRADAWYADAVNWAAETGIVSGYGNGDFGPNDPVTREQMATLLHRYAGYKGYDTAQTADLDRYGDSGSISSYAQKAMDWTNAAGLMTGTDQELLLPLGNTTRSQAASILMRFSNAF